MCFSVDMVSVDIVYRKRMCVMANPFETTNLKGVKINRTGEVPSLEFGRAPADYLESYQANVSIFSGIDNRLGLLDAEIDKLDKEGLMESIERDKREAEERVNKKSTAEKIAQWTSLASTGLSALSAFSSLGGAKKIASTAQAAAKTVSYSDMSDADLTTKLNEFTKKKTDAQKVIDEQTPIQRAQQKIVDDINANTHEECLTLKNLEDEVKKLDLESGTDPLVNTYKATTADLAEANKGAEGSLPECTALKSANESLENAKTNKIYKAGENGTKVEDTAAEQDAIRKAQEEVRLAQKALDAKKKELVEKQKTDKQAIDNEKTAREAKVTAQQNKIDTIKKEAQTKNGEACTKIGNSTDTINTADAQIKLIQAEQSKRASKKK